MELSRVLAYLRITFASETKQMSRCCAVSKPFALQQPHAFTHDTDIADNFAFRDMFANFE